MPFNISSPGFQNGKDIPKKFTCDGGDVSPALSWTDPPPGSKSFALIADDPDAPMGTWTHWVLFDLPPAMTSLPEGVPKVSELTGGGRLRMEITPTAQLPRPISPGGAPPGDQVRIVNAADRIR